MKKRLLSLLLAMAMIVSMVPFQALAEEPDETPALLEAAEGIAPEDETTEVTIPETTEETVPETTEETVPETTEETVPETTEETVPETTEETAPETTEELVPETTEETISEVLEETVPELSELILPEGEAPETAPYIVKTRIGRPPVNLAMIENGALDGYTFAVDEAYAAYAEIKGNSNLVLKDITIPEGEDVVVHVTATSAEGARVTVEVHVYAATFGIEFSVNDFSEAVTKHTLNFYGEKSFTLAVKASDDGPLGNVKWTEPSTKLLKRSIDETTGALTYTSTGKTGTAAITVTSLDRKGVSNTLTVNVVKVPENFQIKYPSSTRKYDEGCLLTAGQKLSLSTGLPKDTTGKVTWDIVGGEYTTSAPCSLDTVAPEGASADGEDWSAIATIDRNKGVLTTYAGVTAENCVITVCATLTPSVDGVDPITAKLPVLIQPPVESFWVSVMGVKNYISEYGSRGEVAQEGAVNRNEKRPWGYDVGEGSLVLFAEGYQTNALISEVNWKISVSSKVAKVQTPEEYFAESYDEDLFRNTLIVTPKAPGKLTFTATSADGSGAKYSGTVEFYGHVNHLSISTPEEYNGEPLHPGETLKLSAAAYYDADGQCPISGGKYSWYVHDHLGNGHDFATIDKNGKLTITNKVTKPTTLYVECYYETKINGYSYGYDAYIDTIQVAPSNEGTLALALKYGEPGYTGYDIIHTAFPWHAAPGESYEIVPVWVGADGNVITDETGMAVPVEGVKYKVSGSACSYKDGILSFNKIGTTNITVTAPLGGKTQSFACAFRCVYYTDSIQIQSKPGADGCITVIGGKTLTLKAVNYSGTKKATDQQIGWEIDEDQFSDDYGENIYNYCWMNWSTGKLTTYPVEEDYYVTVIAQPADLFVGSWENRPTDEVTIHIIPEKTQYRSYALSKWTDWYDEEEDCWYNEHNGHLALTGQEQTLNLGEDFKYLVQSYNRDVSSLVTDITSSNPRLAAVVKKNGVVTGIRIPADTKPGKVTFTIKGKVQAGEDADQNPIWKDAPSVKFTLNLVRPVTSIEITRPTNRDGSLVPLYVGKSLKLPFKVSPDATNKKLNWYVGYYNGDPSEEFDWQKLSMIDDDTAYYYDKTTVKNGVLSVDKSFDTGSRCYAVWAESQDGFRCSDPIVIQAYAMTGAIQIASVDGWTDYLNNRTVTIQQGETLNLKALVSDVAGYEGANPDVNWSISGNRGYVEFKESFEGSLDTLKVTGKKPGTVTVKATAIDGSKKTATFKLVVKPHTLSAPELETDKLYRSCFTTAPSIAYDYTRGDEVINWLKPTDVEFSSDYSKVKITYDKDGGEWLISVDDNAKLGKVVTITVKDVRTDIEEIDRGQPLSMKFTIVDPQP